MNTAALLEEGLALHRAGRYDDAARVCGELLNADPSNVAALRLMGVAHTQRGLFDQALMVLQAAARFAPEAPEIFNDIGIALRQKGACREALEAFACALRLHPAFAAAHFNNGVTLEMCGLPEQAEEAYTLALDADPSLQEARFNRGAIRFRNRRYAEAAEDLAVVRQERRELREAHMLYGKACHELGRLAEAREAFTALLSLSPRSSEAHMRLGMTFLAEAKYDDALKALREARRCGENLPETDYVLGLVHLKRYEWHDAVEALQRALSVRPDRPEIASALALVARQQGNLAEARRYLDAALSADPNHADAHWQRADLLLLQGEYEPGWEEFEWRWKHRGFLTPSADFAEPVWNGEDIGGRTILLYPEQGLGDTLHFVRYAPMVAAAGATVYLGSPPELADILRTVPGVTEVVTTRRAAPPFDLLCPLLSLPRLFGTRKDTIPATVPYVQADPGRTDAWAARLRGDRRLRVGIIWSGNPLQENNRHRSCRFEDMAPLCAVPGVRLFSLQKGEPREELHRSPQASRVTDLADELTDFSETAAVMHHLDVLISTDTGPVHLAGALGRPVWLLVSAIPDWRWGPAGNHSPWYPTFSIYRQEQVGVWGPAIRAVSAALAEMAQSRSAAGRSA